MTYLHCQCCGWTGPDTDTEPSWPVTARTIDEPFPLCPACGCPDFEDAEMCDGCGLPVAWCECYDYRTWEDE